MLPHVSVLERAFQLARSGRYGCISEIKKRLTEEGYTTDQVTGPILRQQLSNMMQIARSDPAPAPAAGSRSARGRSRTRPTTH
jgi:hypothetical protein